MNKLAPGSVKKIATKGTNFQLMENIQRFQAGMKAYGVPQEEIFQTADLFEKRNVAQVYGIKSFDSFCYFFYDKIGGFVVVLFGQTNPKTPRMERPNSRTKNG